ncbi:cytoskeleton-associated protein 2 isoform X2 [Pteronotus mesoamericanus]|uniref:cytoskeleton-associated protein 2 isoform X2 n=1 Tax=Pteronotus mesoamericanus TaxID=1884717 RepID=UPI0023ED0904|nr:cytoskeleton-associated protein 2 isoform X2 [Pteronotus parnellii mesoamericanus]
MSTPVVPRDLPLPPNQRAQFACGEQRKQKLKEHMLKRKTFFAYKQENQILSSRNQRVMASEGQVQEETKALKLKAKMDDKENVHRPTKSKNNITMEKTCIPLKPSKELTNSTIVIDAPNLENNNQTLQSLPIKNEPQGQRLTLSQTFHIKNNNKKKQVATEKPKQDANMLKKPVLGSYRGQIVQSKVNSFRKPVQVKDESSAAANKLAATVSKATKPQPASTSSVPGKSHRAPAVMISTKSASTTSQSKQLLRPPIRRHYSNARDTQDSLKQGISRPSFHVTIRKGSRDKEIAQLNPVSSSVKASSFQEVKRNKTLLSRSITSEIIARPASLSNTRLIEQSKTIDQRRHTIAKATIDSRSAQPKETAAERKARLGEWRASKGRALKRPPSSAAAQPPSAGQEGKPVGSFWTTMAEEDEQRLFTEKVNKTFSECLNLINEGCPKEEILGTLNDLVKDIPDAKKLVKYWICLARIEPLTSSIENIISIYEKAILAGAQPIEEMRHAIVDILTMKSQEKVKLGENFEEACTTKEQIQEAHPEDTGVNVESEKPEMENKHHRSVVFQDCEKEHIDKTKDPTNDAKTPNTETRNSCLIKYNVSTTPYLQSVKKKMQFDEINSTLKELKFLTPVRRSRRLQDKTSKLPDMLKDHYPCVSSLEQLTELGDEMDAFICRPNAALCRMYLETETTSEK